MDRNIVLNYLRSMSKGELADLLYELWDDWPRHPNNYYDKANHMPIGETKLALAEVAFTMVGQNTWSLLRLR
jgi:hypothetical protein